MLLVVQLYCPLESSPYHRTLYIFICVNRECRNDPYSWQVLRSQVLDESNKEVKIKDRTGSKHPIGDLGTPSDNWGTNPDVCGTDPDDWGTDPDDWGTDPDDWGTDVGQSISDVAECGASIDDLGADMNNGENVSKSETVDFGNDLNSSGDCCMDALIMDTNSVDVSNHQSDHNFEAKENEKLVDLSRLNIHDVDDNAELNSSVVKPDIEGQLTEERVNDIMCLLTSEQQGLNVSKQTEYESLVSYHVNVTEESAFMAEDNTGHIEQLLQQYKQSDYSNLQNIHTQGHSQGGKGDERYEKEAVVHGDRTFHKFMKKLSVCPEQCIRYHWNGDAMFISPPKKDMMSQLSKCLHCNGESVYELQLMPALVNVLQSPNISGPATEFGTVIVFTCKTSCWNDTDLVRKENILVLPDPDQHLICK